MPVMFSRPCGLFESRSTTATPSFLKNSFRARATSRNAANGDGAGGCPLTGGGACIGRINSAFGLPGFGGERLSGSWKMTIAPFSFPRNFSKSSFVFASKYTTGPRTTPLVPGDHPADAIVSGCPVGLTMRACAVPRAQECPIVHGSRCTLGRPYSPNLAAVHSFPFFNFVHPHTHGPTPPHRAL